MHYIFSLMQRYLLSKAGSTMIGLFVAISLIWFAGPMLGLSSVLYRLLAIGAIVLIALGIWGVRYIIASRRGARLKEELGRQGESKASAKKLEIQLLKEKMNEAISSLKSSELGAKYRGNAALYALPWYMIIGPSAAGKSSLLRQSGLHFPFSNEDDIHIKGYGGTRNCDWWFSDQAVILDTAGRYTTEEDDREEWTAFLGMLRKHRRRMPINGVMIAISLPDLLTADNEKLDRHVKVIRNRISELIQQLGLVFPIYLVFTKADLLQGFEAFFEDLSEPERNQIWGVYLYDKHDANGDIAQLFSENLNALYERLCDIRLRKVSMQRNLSRKSELFDFPNQFAAATERLIEFVNLLFRENPYQETPQFAGVYFTSATQEGQPIERVIGNLRQAFGFTDEGASSAEGREKRPYFVKSLFTEVIFKIQGGVRASRRKMNWDRSFRTVSVLFALALIGGGYLFLSGSYATNSFLLNRGVERVSEVAEATKPPVASAQQAYATVSALYAHYHNLLTLETEMPWIKQAALYRANEQIDSLKSSLDKALHQAYWNVVSLELESRLAKRDKQWEAATPEERERLHADYYETLKLYLRITRSERFEYEEVLSATQKIWKELVFANTKVTDEQLSQVDEMSRFYLEARKAQKDPYWEANPRLIERARAQLRTTPDAEQLYAQLIAVGSSRWQDKTLDGLLKSPDQAYLVSKEVLPGIYSADAWYDYVKPKIEELVKIVAEGDWVLDDAVPAGDAVPAAPEPEVAAAAARNDNDPPAENPQGAEGDAAPGLAGEALDKPALAQKVGQDLRALYFKDYSENWTRFLRSVRYRLPADLSEKSRALMNLSSDSGQLASLFLALGENIALRESKIPVPKAVPPIPKPGDAVAVEVPKIESPRVAELEALMPDLITFSIPAEGEPISASLRKYLDALSGVYGEVDTLSASVDVKRESENFAAQLFSGSGSKPNISKAWIVTTTLLNGVRPNARKILSAMLSPPIQMAWSGVMGQATSELEREWRSSVLKPYKEMLAEKFPFYAKGDDAALADVAEFYRPENGILWSFVNQRLAPYLRKTGKGWSPRKWLGVGVKFSKGFLEDLSTAQQITDALYTYGNNEPKMTFYIQPDPNSGVREMQLESNGQLYRYRNGPQVWQRFDWPGDMQQIGARVMGIADHGRALGELRADGPWGLFHLLTQAEIIKVGATHYKTVWELPSSDGGRVSVAFKLRADRQDNIFNFKLINSFRLPESLFSRRRSKRVAVY